VGKVKPKFLSPNQISELVWDSKSDEVWGLSDSSSEDKGRCQNACVSCNTIQMGHCIWDKLTDYWATTVQLHAPFYSSTMKRDRYLDILHSLHFTDNKNEPGMTEENSDRLWKIRNLSEILNMTF
jgi:hypothetical protein